MSKAGLPKSAVSRSSVTVAVVAVLSASLLAGCANRHHIIVGSIPDDYRTNHPIVVAERDKVLDVPVGASSQRLTRAQRALISGHLADYDRKSGAAVNILVPVGSANAGAASFVADQIVQFAEHDGIPRGLILVRNYPVDSVESTAPIRIAYAAMSAGTGPCGRWPEDVLETGENKHYANFGCAYQQNLAAQLADPLDILGPRKRSEIDPENRVNAIEQYKARGVAEDFNRNSEVDY